MNQKNPTLLVTDVETTGTNPDQDQVVEIAILKGTEAEVLSASERAAVKTWRVKPSIPIPQVATDIHGISNADVANCPAFSQLAGEVRQLIEGADIIIGYNVEFDLQMIQAEFKRAGEGFLNLGGKLIVDPLQIWRKMEPRSLTAAVKRFAGRDFEGAHAADADVTATADVLGGMLEQFGLGGKSWKELSEFGGSRASNWVGPTKHILWKGEKAVLSFGKHRGKSIAELVEVERDYVKWVMGTDFPEHVKEILGKAMEVGEGEFDAWVKGKFS